MSKAPQTLTFDTDIPAPQSRARVNPVRALIKQALDTLPLDQSYHIPATTEVPEPHKLYGDMVVAANGEYVKKAVTGEKSEIKHFTIKLVDETDKRGKGARLFRVANLSKADAVKRAEASAAALETRRANKEAKDAAAAAPAEEAKAE